MRRQEESPISEVKKKKLYIDFRWFVTNHNLVFKFEFIRTDSLSVNVSDERRQEDLGSPANRCLRRWLGLSLIKIHSLNLLDRQNSSINLPANKLPPTTSAQVNTQPTAHTLTAANTWTVGLSRLHVAHGEHQN